MNNESVKSLIELLVKKSGFDLSLNDSALELEKTINNIAKFETELISTTDEFNKRVIDKTLESLRIRKENWENNAEVLGRNLYDAYQKGEFYESVKLTIDKLADLAKEDEKKTRDGSLMSYVYNSIKESTSKLSELKEKVKTFNYKDESTIALDKKMKDYLEERLAEFKKEANSIEKELSELNTLEERENKTLEKVKEYISTTEKELERLTKVKNETINREVSVETWEKLERMIVVLTTRLENANETSKKLNSSIKVIIDKRESLNERKKIILTEIDADTTRLDSIKTRLEKDDYIDNLQKIVDLNNIELLEIKLKSLNNKKEVIYINVDQIKAELIEEWKKPSDEPKEVREPEKKIVGIEKIISNSSEEKKVDKKQEVEQKTTPEVLDIIEEKPEEKKEEVIVPEEKAPIVEKEPIKSIEVMIPEEIKEDLIKNKVEFEEQKPEVIVPEENELVVEKEPIIKTPVKSIEVVKPNEIKPELKVKQFMPEELGKPTQLEKPTTKEEAEDIIEDVIDEVEKVLNETAETSETESKPKNLENEKKEEEKKEETVKLEEKKAKYEFDW